MENNVNKLDDLNNIENKEKAPEQGAKDKKKLLSREVIAYLIFGVMTTVVGWVVYFLIMFGGRILLSVPNDDTTSGKYIALYTAAQIIQWVCAVLFAFFTNRKWVFTEADKEKKILPQLTVFAGGRVLTFVLDYGVTYFGTIALCALIPSLSHVAFIGKDLNVNEITAKLIAAILVIIGNYFFSKIFVFKKQEKQQKSDEE